MRLIVYDVPTIAQVDDRRQEGTQDPLPLVRPVGLEPTHPNGYLILSQACLPIPPRAHDLQLSTIQPRKANQHPRWNANPHAPRIPDFELGQRKGAETNTSNNHATTVRPTSGTHAHQPHHRPAQPACADTLNRPNPDRPQLTHQHREHPGANTQAPPAPTQRTTNAATHPSVTAPAAASIPALFPLPGRRSRT